MSSTMQRGMRMRMNLPRVVLIGILLLVTNVLNFQLPRLAKAGWCMYEGLESWTNPEKIEERNQLDNAGVM